MLYYPSINQNFSQQINSYQGQGTNQDQVVLEAIQNLNKKVEEKILKIEQNQNYIKNVVDGLVSDIIDLKRRDNGGTNRGGRGSRGGYRRGTISGRNRRGR